MKDKDVVIGGAVVAFSPVHDGWIVPGRKVVKCRIEAKRIARRIAYLLNKKSN